jgi:excisionase family DNA binding protein
MKSTHEQLPEFFFELRKDVSNILQLLTSTKSAPPEDDNQWLNLEALCKYRPDKPAKATVYAEVQAKKIPFYKKGKKLLFRKSDIDKWLMEGKIKALAETEKEVTVNTNSYLSGLNRFLRKILALKAKKKGDVK